MYTRFAAPILGLLLLVVPVGAQTSKDLQLKPNASSRPAVKGKRYALLIGISQYRNGINPLRFTHNDVKAFKGALTSPSHGGFLADNVVTLFDGKGADGAPTLLEVGKKLKWLQLMAKPEDTVVIYFSGHGIYQKGRSYLLTQDSDPGVPELSALSVTDFNVLVGEIPAKKKLIVLDACHSGGVSVAARGSSSMSAQMMESMHSKAEGEIRLLSCKTEEQSYEATDLKRGVFSHFLVKGMTTSEADQNRDGWVTFSELEQYVQTQVPNWAAKNLTASQNPVSESRVSGVFVISRVGKGTAPPPREETVNVIEEVATAAAALPPPVPSPPPVVTVPARPWSQGIPPWAPKKIRDLLPKAEAGDAEAQYRISAYEWDAETSFAQWAETERRRFLLKAAQQGHSRARIRAAGMVLGISPLEGFAMSVEQALAFLYQKAEEGDLDALGCLALGLHNGGSEFSPHFPKDPSRARSFLERYESLARAAGSGEYLRNAASLWAFTFDDKQRARAILAGLPPSGLGFMTLALMEESGSPRREDYYAQAYQRYREEGDYVHAASMAQFLEDKSQAWKARRRECLEAGLANGSVQAKYELGCVYLFEERSRGLSLLEQAALQGHVGAQRMLGQMLVTEAPGRALWWLEYAETQTQQFVKKYNSYKEITELRAKGITPIPPVAQQ